MISSLLVRFGFGIVRAIAGAVRPRNPAEAGTRQGLFPLHPGDNPPGGLEG